MSPECIRGHYFGPKVDIWSVGILLREMIVGEPPYIDFPPLRAMFLLTTQGLSPLEEQEKFSPQLITFYHRCTEAKTENRATAEELLQDPFLLMACTNQDILQIFNRAHT